MHYSRNSILVFFLFLVACAGNGPTPTATSQPQIENQPTTESAVIEIEPTTPPPTSSASEPTPSTEEPTPIMVEPAKNLPLSTLFETGWLDMSPFEAGLIDSEQSVLGKLLGAPIYHMDIAIEDDLTSVSGRQEIFYTNMENVALDAVYFHLFPNILGGRVEISAVTANGQPVSPELEVSNSILRVPLVSEIAPGGQVVIQLEFLVDVPTEGGSNYGVFATIDDVMALAHFYPQVVVFDDSGWVTELPAGNADVTYSDSSYYLVRLTAPEDLVLMTSGIILDRQTNNNFQVLSIASGPTRDFYIAGSDRYIMSTTTIGQTTIKSYGFPEFSERVEQAGNYVAAAMESFNSRFGTYPFTEFEIGPTPNLALGVEYPGVVVLNSRIYNPEETFGSTPSAFYLEGTTVHEVGHQWFYSVIGNDQPNEPWVDESLTQFATYLYFVDQYGVSGADGFRQSFVNRWNVVEQADIPIGMPAGNYEGSEYSAIIYGRGPLFFEALSNQIGEATFNQFVRDYFQTYKYQIVTGTYLKNLAEEHCGCDLTNLFNEWVGDLP